MPASSRFHTTAIRVALGTASLRISIRLALSCTTSIRHAGHVPARTGQARDQPIATASPPESAMTIGMVEVARAAATVANPPWVAMRSTLSRTISSASAGRRSSLPSANRTS